MRCGCVTAGSVLYAFLVICFVLEIFRLEGAEEGSDRSRTNEVIQITGRVLPEPSGSTLQFQTETGSAYKLVRNDHSEALFVDRNLHSKILVLKGRERPDKQFELTGNLYSVKDGKIHELFYYCDICAVETSFPGPCVCCREPVVLTERETGERQ